MCGATSPVVIEARKPWPTGLRITIACKSAGDQIPLENELPTLQHTAHSVPQPILVTGIAGVAGFNAFHFLRRRFGDAVIGVRRPDLWPLAGPGIIACDVTNHDCVAKLFDQYGFQSVVNCLGSCKLKSCELDPMMAHRVNVVGTDNVISQAKQHNSTVVHTSIDLVFAGREPDEHPFTGYIETDTPDPVTVYGLKMVEAEQVVLSHCPNACVLRISLPMGNSFNGHAGAIDWIASRFKQNKPATLYFDEVRTPTYTDCLSRLMLQLLASPLSGIYHAGGSTQLSLYQIAQIVNVVGGYDPNLLQGCPRIEAGPMPPRAGNVALNSNKLTAALGFAPFVPWPATASLVPTHLGWHQDKSIRSLFASTGPEQIAKLLYQNHVDSTNEASFPNGAKV